MNLWKAIEKAILGRLPAEESSMSWLERVGLVSQKREAIQSLAKALQKTTRPAVMVGDTLIRPLSTVPIDLGAFGLKTVGLEQIFGSMMDGLVPVLTGYKFRNVYSIGFQYIRQQALLMASHLLAKGASVEKASAFYGIVRTEASMALPMEAAGIAHVKPTFAYKADGIYLDGTPVAYGIQRRVIDHLKWLIESLRGGLLSSAEADDLIKLLDAAPKPEVKDVRIVNYSSRTAKLLQPLTEEDIDQIVNEAATEAGVLPIDPKYQEVKQKISDLYASELYAASIAMKQGIGSPIFYIHAPFVQLKPPNIVGAKEAQALIIKRMHEMPKLLRNVARNMLAGANPSRISLSTEAFDYASTVGTLYLLGKKDEILNKLVHMEEIEGAQADSWAQLVAFRALNDLQNQLIDWAAASRTWESWDELVIDVNKALDSSITKTIKVIKDQHWRMPLLADALDTAIYKNRPFMKTRSFFLLRHGDRMFRSDLYADMLENIFPDIDDKLQAWLDWKRTQISKLGEIDPALAYDATDKAVDAVQRAAEALFKTLDSLLPPEVDRAPIQRVVDSFKDFWIDKRVLYGTTERSSIVGSLKTLLASIQRELAHQYREKHWFWGVRLTDKKVPVPQSGYSRAIDHINGIIEKAWQSFMDALDEPPAIGITPAASVLPTKGQQLLASAIDRHVIDTIQDNMIWLSGDYAALIANKSDILSKVTSQLLDSDEVQSIIASDSKAIEQWVIDNSSYIADLIYKALQETSELPETSTKTLSHAFLELDPATRNKISSLVSKALIKATDSESLNEALSKLASYAARKILDISPIWPGVKYQTKYEYLNSLIRTYIDDIVKVSGTNFVVNLMQSGDVQLTEDSLTFKLGDETIKFNPSRMIPFIYWDTINLLKPIVEAEAGINPYLSHVGSALINNEPIHLGKLTSQAAVVGVTKLNSARDVVRWITDPETKKMVDAWLPQLRAEAMLDFMRALPADIPLSKRLLMEHDVSQWLDKLMSEDVAPYIYGEVTYSGGPTEEMYWGISENVLAWLNNEFAKEWLSNDALQKYSGLITDEEADVLQNMLAYTPYPFRRGAFSMADLKNSWIDKFHEVAKDPEKLHKYINDALYSPAVTQLLSGKSIEEAASIIFREISEHPSLVDPHIGEALADFGSIVGWSQDTYLMLSKPSAKDFVITKAIEHAAAAILKPEELVSPPKASEDIEYISIIDSTEKAIKYINGFIGEGDEPDIELLKQKITELKPTVNLGAWDLSPTVRDAVMQALSTVVPNLDAETLTGIGLRLKRLRDQLVSIQQAAKDEKFIGPEEEDLAIWAGAHPEELVSSEIGSPFSIPNAQIRVQMLPGGWWKKPRVFSRSSIVDSLEDPDVAPLKESVSRACNSEARYFRLRLVDELVNRWDKEHPDAPVSLEAITERFKDTRRNLSIYFEHLFNAYAKSIAGVKLGQIDSYDVLDSFYSLMKPVLDAIAEDYSTFITEKPVVTAEDIRAAIEKADPAVKDMLYSNELREVVSNPDKIKTFKLEPSSDQWTPDSYVSDKKASLISDILPQVLAKVPAASRDQIAAELIAMIDHEAETIWRPIASAYFYVADIQHSMDPTAAYRQLGWIIDNVIKQRFGFDNPHWVDSVISTALSKITDSQQIKLPKPIATLQEIATADDEDVIRKLAEHGYAYWLVEQVAEYGKQIGVFKDDLFGNQWAVEWLTKIVKGELDVDEFVKDISSKISGHWLLNEIKLNLWNEAERWQRALAAVYSDPSRVSVPDVNTLIADALHIEKGKPVQPLKQVEEATAQKPEEATKTENAPEPLVAGETPIIEEPEVTSQPKPKPLSVGIPEDDWNLIVKEVGVGYYSQPVQAEVNAFAETPIDYMSKFIDSEAFKDRLEMYPEFKKAFVQMIADATGNEELRTMIDNNKFDEALDFVYKSRLYADPALDSVYRSFIWGKQGSQILGHKVYGMNLPQILSRTHSMLVTSFAKQMVARGERITKELIQERLLPTEKAAFSDTVIANFNYFVMNFYSSSPWRRRVLPSIGEIKFQKETEEGFDIASPDVAAVFEEYAVNGLFRRGHAIYRIAYSVRNPSTREAVQRILAGYAHWLYKKVIAENSVDGHLYLTQSGFERLKKEIENSVYERGLLLINELMQKPDWEQLFDEYMSLGDSDEEAFRKIKLHYLAQTFYIADSPDDEVRKMAIISSFPSRAFARYLSVPLDDTLYHLNQFAEDIWNIGKHFLNNGPEITSDDVNRAYVMGGFRAFDPATNPNADQARQLLYEILSTSDAYNADKLMDVLDLAIWIHHHPGAAIPNDPLEARHVDTAYKELAVEAQRRNSEYWLRYLYSYPQANARAYQLSGFLGDLSRWFSTNRASAAAVVYKTLENRLIDAFGRIWTPEQAEALWAQAERARQNGDIHRVAYYYSAYAKPFADQLKKLGKPTEWENIWITRAELLHGFLLDKHAEKVLEQVQLDPTNEYFNPWIFAPMGPAMKVPPVPMPKEEPKAKPEDVIGVGIEESFTEIWRGNE